MKKGFTLAEVLMAKRTSGIENNILHSRESEPKEPSSKIKKLAAFTLAEVLITLAIIGVVAALTIPVVMAKFQQRELYTRFMVAYNTFNNVYVQLKSDGLIDVDNATREMLISNDDMLSKLKYTKRCSSDNSDGCFDDGHIWYKDLTGKKPQAGGFFYHRDLNRLPNGADFMFTNTSFGQIECIIVKVDTNGIDKGPNTVGRDFFEFYFYPYQSSIGFESDAYDSDINELAESKSKLKFDNNNINNYCNPSSGDTYRQGTTCGAKMLLEGKMDY